jgi:hypothetical protein
MYLADALQYCDCLLEVSDVKDGQYQLDVAEVTVARCKALMARFALVSFSGDAHTRVKRAIRIDGSAFVKVEEASIRYFDLGLIDNVLT